MRKRYWGLWLLFLAAMMGLMSPLSQGNPRVQIPQVSNLQAEATAANARRVPLLLMFAFHECPYCAVVREEFLEPMKISGDYEDRVQMRIIDMEGGSLIDFDGKPVLIKNLSRRYGVKLGPTVILVDGQGRLLTEPLVGITTPDFYGGYLDDAIATALAKLKS